MSDSDSDAGASDISDVEVFKRKLMMDGEGKGDSQKIDALLRNFIVWCDAKDQTDEEIVDGYEQLSVQLEYLTLISHKSAEAQRAHARQIEEFDKMSEDLEKQIAEVKEVIAQRSLELKEAKKIRFNKMKYDALGRVISLLPDRKESMKQLEKIEDETKILKLENETLQKKSDEREKQVRLLLTAARELKNKLRNELRDPEDSNSE